MEGGRNLGLYLDQLIFEKSAPDIAKALDFYGLKLKSKVSKETQLSSSWLGLNLANKSNKVIVSSHQTDSPLRNLIMPGDELVAINKVRIKDVKSMKNLLAKLDPSNVELCYTHEGIVKIDKIDLRIEPELKNKLDGKGNKKWHSYISSRIT